MTQRESHPYLVLFALWLMVFSASSQVIIISPILPRIGEELLIDAELQGWLITAYAVFLSIFALITGPISDKVGRRLVLLFGSGAMAVALSLHAVADTFVSLLIVRGFAGMAGGMLSGAAVSYVGDYFPYKRRGWANGWVMSGVAVGQIVGIPIGIILADQFGFRSAFLMFGASMLLATGLIYFYVPQPDVVRDAERLTIKRAIKNYAELLARPVVAAASAVYFVMFFSIGLYILFLPTWLENTLQVCGPEIASVFLVGGIANVVFGPAAGRLSDTVGRKPIIIISCVGFSIVMVLTTYFIDSLWLAYVFFAAAMIMVAMRLSPLQSLLTALVSENRRGSLLCLTIAVGNIGFGIGGAVAGATYTKLGYASNTILGAIAILIVAVLVHFFLPEPSDDAAV
jgi:predicted MFS family arabinose efflux permease